MGSTLLVSGSILAAFFAGGVALFAPCCIVFLAPSYMSVAVKNRKWRLLPFTFVFAAGLALVLVPITLGISLVAGTISHYHEVLYYAGGALMLALGAYSLSGRMWSLPSFLRAPDTSRGDTGSFFALGVFSGVASSCCAPVLAGVMTLSALSSSPVGAVTLGLAYVFGMTFPLFVMALAWDKFHLGERRWMRAKAIRIRVAGRSILTNTVNLAVAITFTVMGVFVIYLANTGTMTGGPGFQVAIGRFLTRVFSRIETWTAAVPELVLGLAILAIAAGFAAAALHHDTPPLPDAPTQEPDDAAAAGDHRNNDITV